jgi:hypothetical protein
VGPQLGSALLPAQPEFDALLAETSNGGLLNELIHDALRTVRGADYRRDARAGFDVSQPMVPHEGRDKRMEVRAPWVK